MPCDVSVLEENTSQSGRCLQLKVSKWMMLAVYSRKVGDVCSLPSQSGFCLQLTVAKWMILAA